MARTQIGLIVGAETNRVYSLVNPDDDGDLDDPRHLQLTNKRGEPVKLVRIQRSQFHRPDDEVTPIDCAGEMSPADVYNLIVRYYIETSEVYDGPDYIDGAV